MSFERIKLPKSLIPLTPAESFEFDPEIAQKLHELRNKIPLYFEPFELLQHQDTEQNLERQGEKPNV